MAAKKSKSALKDRKSAVTREAVSAESVALEAQADALLSAAADAPVVEDVTASAVVSDAAAQVLAVVAWMSQHVAFADPTQALVVGLWSLMTWCQRAFDSIPYLDVTAIASGSGKSVLLETLAALSGAYREDVPSDYHGVITSDCSKANVIRLVKAFGAGAVTLCIDEAQQLANLSAADLDAHLTGYRPGGQIFKTISGEVERFPTFAARAFAQIGDLFTTIRSRCIVVRLERRQPAKKYRQHTMIEEATDLLPAWRALAGRLASGQWLAAEYDHPAMYGRADELWQPIMRLARATGLLAADAGLEDRLIAWMLANEESKQDRNARTHRQLRDAGGNEARAEQSTMRDQIVKDALAIVGAAEWMESRVLCERLVAASPVWAAWRGGLHAKELANLLQITPTVQRLGKGRLAPLARIIKRSALEARAVALGLSGAVDSATA